MARKDELVVVRTPFFAGTRMVGVGEVWGVDDPVVKNYPKAFRPLEVKASVEPVVRRPVRRTTTRTAPKRQAKKS